MRDTLFYVYIHRRKDDGKIFYVGKGKNNRAYSKYRQNAYWHNVVNRHGFVAEIIAKNLEEQEAFATEIFYISYYKALGCCLVNMSNGGEGQSGFRHSDETKKKLSKPKEQHPNYGKKHSKEVRQKISKTLTGKKLPKDVCLKMSLSRQGEKHPKADKNIYNFKHETGLEFRGTRLQLCLTYKLKRQYISRLFGNKPYKQTCGWFLVKETDL